MAYASYLLFNMLYILYTRYLKEKGKKSTAAPYWCVGYTFIGSNISFCIGLHSTMVNMLYSHDWVHAEYSFPCIWSLIEPAGDIA